MICLKINADEVKLPLPRIRLVSQLIGEFVQKVASRICIKCAILPRRPSWVSKVSDSSRGVILMNIAPNAVIAIDSTSLRVSVLKSQ